MSDTDTAFVDLIKEQPAPREKFPSYTDEQYQALVDNYQPWRIEICAHNGEPLFRSTEHYKDERDARRAIEIALGPNTNLWLRQEGKEPVAVRVAWRD